jgi:hypothetical protein
MGQRLVIVAALFGAAVMFLTGCNDDTTQIRTCFAEYERALVDRDGRAAIDIVSDSTIDYYDDILAKALDDSPEQVRALGVLDRLQVISLRHRMPAERLRRMEGYELFVHSVDEGFISRITLGEGSIGDVTVTGDSATGVYLLDGRPTTFEWGFVREYETWNVDVMSLRPLYESALKRMIRESGMSANEFIIMSLEEATDRGVRLNIWQPLGRG